MARANISLRSMAASALALSSVAVPLVAVQAPANAVDADVTATDTTQFYGLKEALTLTPLKNLTVTTEVNLPSTFDSQWKVRTDGDSLNQYTTNKITSTSTGLEGYGVATITSNKSVGFAYGSATNANKWAEIGTSGNAMMIAENTIKVPLRVSVGSFFKNFTVDVPYSASSTQTVAMPQDVIAAAAAQGLDLTGASITVKTSALTDMADGVKRLPAMCWTPSTNVANKIDIENSKGIARVNNTFVIPAGIVSKESRGYKRIKLASNIAFKGDTFNGRLSGLELELKDNGSGSASATLYGYAGTTDASGKTTYPSVQQAPLLSSYIDAADPTSWDFDASDLSTAVFSGEVFNAFGSPLVSESPDYMLGDLDLGCATHKNELVTGFNQLITDGGITPSETELSFTDVPSDAQFSEDILWVAKRGILKGYSDGTYHPLENITRGATAAALYRMAGSPAFTPPEVSPFKDVPTNYPFYTEVAWLASKGITTGYADGTFHPEESINRDAMAAFLYRYAGSPDYTAPTTSKFTDISSGDQFYKEVSWLAEKKISTGWTDGSFRPRSQVHRDAIAAFLHRYDTMVGVHL